MPPFAKHFLPVVVTALFVAPAVHAAPMDIDLPAQPLSDAIQHLTRLSGLSVIGEGRLLEGKTAPTVKGRLEPEEALRRLLSSSGLTVTVNGTSAVIRQATGTTLKEVRVVDARPAEGSAEAGYRPETAKTTGPWGSKPIQDTPYSLTVVPTELIQNMVSNSTDQVFMISPSAQPQFLSANADLPAAGIRGFGVATAGDGIRMINSYGITVEEVDRIELLNSLNGFLYGGGAVGGIINYVLKRPTATRLADVTVGNYGGSQYFVHADLGGPLDAEGRFGYRLNVLTQDGDTAVENQRLRRSLLSGALDWRPANGMLLQIEAAHRDYESHGGPAVINASLRAGNIFPPAPDANKTYSQPWTYNNVKSDRASMAFRWELNDSLTLRAAYRYQQDERDFVSTIDTLERDGTFSTSGSKNIFGQLTNQGEYAYLDAKFTTASVAHKLTVGFSENSYNQSQPQDSSISSPTVTGLTFANPYYPEPTFAPVGVKPYYTSSRQRFKNVVVGDDVRFSDQWSALVGVNRATIDTNSYNTSSVRTGGYNNTKATPTLSLLYKPIPTLTTYATYIESLEAGEVVAISAVPPYRNAGAVLPPTLSKQYELGLKAALGDALLTAALYRIDKANTFDVLFSDGTRTRNQDGREVHKGIELGLSGKVTPRLTLFGGGTVMDAKITKTNTASLLGTTPAGVAEKLAKLYAEYRLPGAEGLVLTGGGYWVGKQYVDAANTQTIPSYTVADLGVRYETRWSGTPLIARLNITNVADKSYYIRPNLGQLGLPRSVALSLTARF